MKTEIFHYNPLTVMIRSAQPRTVSTIQGNAQMVAAILLASSTTTGAYTVKGMAMVGQAAVHTKGWFDGNFGSIWRHSS